MRTPYFRLPPAQFNELTLHNREKEPSRPMDTIVLIMFASVISTMTALSFIELRRIRKKLESKAAVAPAVKDLTAA
jgi:hypothetical protein